MPIMNHTRQDDEWIRAKVAATPLYELKDEKGAPSCIFNSGPVRLSYPHLLTPVQNKKDLSKDPKCSTGLWFTPCHDLRPLYGAAIRMIAESKKVGFEIIAQSMIPGVVPEKIGGMSTPFHDQREKLPKPGYTPGCMYMNASTDRKVPVRRTAGGKTVPVTDEKLIYGGIWAVVTFNLYISRESLKGQIPARLCAGLMAAFLFADDTPLGVGEADADKLFAGLQGAEELGVPDQAAIQGAFNQGGMAGGMAGGMGDWGQHVPAQPQFAQQPALTPEQLLRRSMGLTY